MDNSIKQIIQELGATNVSDIRYKNEKWIITYKNGLTPDEFESFIDAYNFIKTEGEQ